MAVERQPVFDYETYAARIHEILARMQGTGHRTSTIEFEAHGYRSGNRGLLVVRDGEDDPVWTIEFCMAPAWLEISEDEFGDAVTKWETASAFVPERVTLIQQATALYIFARHLEGVDVAAATAELAARRKGRNGR